MSTLLKPIRIGEAFGPVPKYRSYLYVYLVLIVVVFVLPWLTPIVLAAPWFIGVTIGVPVVAIVLFALYWIPLYYGSVTYRLTVTEITWERGVWFRQTGIVPYNRITNVDIAQGPLMRYFSFSALHIQTAGYSAQARAEIVLNGIEDAGDLQETIMGFVRSTRPVAVEGEPEALPTIVSTDDIVEELRAIRRLLEKQVKR